MPLLISIAIIGIVWYILNQSKPETKYRKAVSRLTSGKLKEASKILTGIFDRHPLAPAKLAECKFEEGLQVGQQHADIAEDCFRSVIELGKKLPAKASKEAYMAVEAKAYLELALGQYNSSISILNDEIKAKALKDNLLFVDKAVKFQIENEFLRLTEKHLLALSEVYFALGKKCEVSNDLLNAIRQYAEAKEFATRSSNADMRYMAATRQGICALKNGDTVERSIFDDASKAPQDYKKDFFYRYAVSLIEDKNYTEADKVIQTYLNSRSSAVEKIRSFVKQGQINHAVERLKEVNDSIGELYNKSFPMETVKKLYDMLDDHIAVITTVFKEPDEKLRNLKPTLFNRLLNDLISTEQYEKAISLITEFPLFWKAPELLKNLSVCSYGMIFKGATDENNYRALISNWLTAIYSDQVILKSFTTSWSENYTFTLVESIGITLLQSESLPQNVNYEEVSEKNISIGAVQRDLLHQFESLMHHQIDDTVLSLSVNDFYTEEKEAIIKIMSSIRADILFAGPFFAKSFGLNDEIIKQLDTEYRKDGNEQALKAGLPYLNGPGNSLVAKYGEATALVSKMISAIKDESLTGLKSLSSSQRKTVIDEFKFLKNDAEDEAFLAFTLVIKKDADNASIIPLMEECILFLTHNEKLKTQCSSFIEDYCNINWKKKPPLKLLELMIKSMRYNPQNYSAAKLLTTLVNNNLMKIANGETTDTTPIYALIDQVKGIRSEALRSALKEFNIIRKNTLSAIGYQNAQAILFGNNLSPQGYRLKKVIDTMQALSGVPANYLSDILGIR